MARLAVPEAIPSTPPERENMALQSSELPKTGFAIEVDGRIKTEFDTKEGADRGAIELKRRFPMLQIRIYDAAAKSHLEISL